MTALILPKDGAITALDVTPFDFMHVLHSAEATGFLELRTMSAEKKSGITRRWLAYPLTEMVDIPCRQHVYYGVVLRSRDGAGRAADCQPTNLLYADLDLKSSHVVGAGAEVLTMPPDELRDMCSTLARATLIRCREVGLEPFTMVYTGHGLQLLWKLPQVVPHEVTYDYNTKIVELLGPELGADRSTRDIPRLFRLPGSYNVKNPSRPLLVEVWGLATGVVDPERLLDIPAQPPRQTKATNPQSNMSVIDAFNSGVSIHSLLEKYGYKRISGARYTRPGLDASGGDVALYSNRDGVLCSCHYSSNDPLAGSKIGRQRTPFNLFCDKEHGGDVKAAVRAAAVQLGLGCARDAVTVSDKGEDEEQEERQRLPAPTRAVEYVIRAGAVVWHDSAKNAYMTVGVDGVQQHHRLPSRTARDYIKHIFFTAERRSISAQALAEAISLLETLGRLGGAEHVTGLRSLHVNGSTYIDVGDEAGHVISVSGGSWSIVSTDDCPVRFVRPQAMRPLPLPEPGGSLAELRPFLNVDEDGFILCASWLLGAFSGRPPFPLLALGGEEGTGKSTAVSVLRRLIDPHRADRRRPPRDERDLFIAAQSNFVLVYDNVSSIPEWLSDSLCVVSTGGVFTTRTLHTDDEETILEAVRPVIVNGIPDLLARPDLAERALTITLSPIPPNQRNTEAEFWSAFEAARPRILGALLSALAVGLVRWPETELSNTPRMADFARLVVAAESALPWNSGQFLRAYSQMQRNSADLLLDDEPLVDAIKKLLELGPWRGTYKQLLAALNEQRLPGSELPKTWPRTAKKLSEYLRRVKAAMRKIGYSIEAQRKNREGQVITIQKTGVITFTKVTGKADRDSDG